jgi:hypothetical protein
MDLDDIKTFLLWCLAINYGVLLVWFGVFVTAHDWLHRLHGRWFKIGPQAFDTIHYTAMAYYKVGILLFILVPWLALTLTRSA